MYTKGWCGGYHMDIGLKLTSVVRPHNYLWYMPCKVWVGLCTFTMFYSVIYC